MGASIVLMLSIGSIAFSTVEITKPTAFSYQEVLEVNISGALNISGFPYLTYTARKGNGTQENGSFNAGFNFSDEIINITILNKSSSAGSYGYLASFAVNVTNRTPDMFWNYTATLTQGRHWLRLNFTNVSRQDNGAFGGALTSERIVQIDIKGNILNIGGFGTVNITLDNGNINTSGYLFTSKNLSVIDEAGNRVYCGFVRSKGVFNCT